MKTKLIIIGLAVVCAGIVFCIAAFHYEQERFWKYEFHTGADGQIMWRCNRQTGEINVFTSFASSYELWRGISHDYLLDKQTGETWRYFRNKTNSYPDEGFSPLPHGYPESVPNPASTNATDLPDFGTNTSDTTPSQH